MGARLLSLGSAVALSLFLLLGVSPGDGVHAAGAGWYGQSAPGKRPHFRPVNRMPRRPVDTRWRPQSVPDQRRIAYATGGSASAWSRVNRVREPVFSGTAVVARNPALSRRPVAGGTAFRPDRRGRGPVGGGSTGSEAGSSWLHVQNRSRFRPTRTKRRVTYEELHPGLAPPFAPPRGAYHMAHGGTAGMYLPHWSW